FDHGGVEQAVVELGMRAELDPVAVFAAVREGNEQCPNRPDDPVELELVVARDVPAAFTDADHDVRPAGAGAAFAGVEQRGNPGIGADPGDVDERPGTEDSCVDVAGLAIEGAVDGDAGVVRTAERRGEAIAGSGGGQSEGGAGTPQPRGARG